VADKGMARWYVVSAVPSVWVLRPSILAAQWKPVTRQLGPSTRVVETGLKKDTVCGMVLCRADGQGESREKLANAGSPARMVDKPVLCAFIVITKNYSRETVSDMCSIMWHTELDTCPLVNVSNAFRTE